MARLSLSEANGICNAALAAGRERGYAPMCIAVLDAGGHPLALQRDERAGISRAEIAIAKAGGCLGMGFGGRELERRAHSLPIFFGALATLFPRGMVALPGGVLLRDRDGDVIGAVGASGDSSEHDEVCVLAGIAAAGLRADAGV